MLRLLVCTILALSLRASESPFEAPEEMKAYVRRVMTTPMGTKPKLQALLNAVFKPQEQGGLGITYDNNYTRTVTQVWQERKANCLSITAFYVAACRTVGIEAKFGEALNTNRWRRVGSMIRFERHVVSIVNIPPMEDLVADFLPQLRRRTGAYFVSIIAPDRMRALFNSNRAVELLSAGDLEGAIVMGQASLETDPESSISWNIYGVVLKAKGDPTGAEAAFRNALTLDGRDFAALGNLEALYREQGKTREAARLREISEDIRKKDPYFHAFLADEALQEGNLEEALKRIKRAIKLLPQESEFYLTLAQVKLAQGEMDDAIKAIDTARKQAAPAEKARWENKMTALEDVKKGKKP